MCLRLTADCGRMGAMRVKVPVVAILFSSALKGTRSVLRGILDYTERHEPWRIVFPEGRDGEQTFDLVNMPCDAIIANMLAGAEMRRIAALGVPTILCEPLLSTQQMMSDLPLADIPIVRMDSRAVGTMAATYYLERGYRSFAYVGETLGMYWSAERRDGFIAALREAGHDAAVYDGPHGARERRRWDAERPRMMRFLSSLPHPTAVFAAMDGRARLVIDACTNAGLNVPEDIAVLGVDDDELICRSCVPTLSSIRTGGFLRGVRIAELLDAMMHGRTVDRTTFVGEPLAVVTRSSTGYDAMRDPVLARALAFIRGQGATGHCLTADVAVAAQCSRRYLEKRFRKMLDISVRELVMREKIERAKTLLGKGTMPIGEIPAACGVNCNSHLSVLFKKATGVTMREWRHAHRDASDE